MTWRQKLETLVGERESIREEVRGTKKSDGKGNTLEESIINHVWKKKPSNCMLNLKRIGKESVVFPNVFVRFFRPVTGIS